MDDDVAGYDLRGNAMRLRLPSAFVVWQRTCGCQALNDVSEIRCVLLADGIPVFEKSAGYDAMGSERWMRCEAPQDFLAEAAGRLLILRNPSFCGNWRPAVGKGF